MTFGAGEDKVFGQDEEEPMPGAPALDLKDYSPTDTEADLSFPSRAIL